jgi:hypothetical protein
VIQSKEDWVLWASAAALRAQREEGNSADSEEGAADQVRLLKRRADSICLTADGVVPLDLTCPSSRDALLEPGGMAYTYNGIVVATDGSLKMDGSMGLSPVPMPNGASQRPGPLCREWMLTAGFRTAHQWR